MLRTTSVRVLDDRDLPEVGALLDLDPVTNVLITSRIEASGLDSWRLGAEVWGSVDGAGRINAVCYAGANLVPAVALDTDPADAVRGFADRARRAGRRCSSIVGPAEVVRPLWALIEPSWGRARDVRTQPLLATADPPRVAPDPAVRRVRSDEIETVLPACIAMFTEEVGVSPTLGDGGALYRTRVQELVAAGRAFARIEDGRVLFKAEIGAVSGRACQVQGVWTDPALRGRGLATAGMAAVVASARAEVAPVVSLYVNDFNAPARATYARVGFCEVGTFVSVLF